MSIAHTTQNAQDGVTLIEIVVTLVVLAGIAGFVGRPLINLIETKFLINERTDQNAGIEYALSRISNEIRFGPKVHGCLASGNGIKIKSKKGSKEYKYRGTDLVVKKEDLEKTDILVPDIDNFSCDKPSNKTPNLYEVILISGGETYMVRAIQRR